MEHAVDVVFRKVFVTVGMSALVLTCMPRALALETKLREIQTFAESFCGSEPRTSKDTSGERRKQEFSVTADAKLGELMRKLSDIGISATAKYGVEQYRGLLQEDIAKELASRRDCRFNVFDRLISFLNLAQSQEIRFTSSGRISSFGRRQNSSCVSDEFESNGIRVCLMNLRDSEGWGLSRDSIALLRVTAADDPPIEVTLKSGDEIELRTYACNRITISEFSASASGGLDFGKASPGKVTERKPIKNVNGIYECLPSTRSSCFVNFKISGRCKPIIGKPDS
ncbi:hypothetical protein [Zoogloea sp.]|uniref:hypothetical protein n=1 Tax=Zoogloea sp. TaxID=49181 RepID=UPI0035AEF9AB